MDPLSLELGYTSFLLFLSFCSSIVGASSGFGGGLMVTPFLIPVVGVKGVVPVMALAATLNNLSRIWVYRREIRFRSALQLGVVVAPGVFIGTFLYTMMPERVAAVVIGFFLIGSVPLRRFLKRRALRPNGSALLGLGFGFGILTGSTPGAGVLLLSLLMGTGLTGQALIGTDAVIGMAASMIKVSMFSSFQLLDASRAFLGLMLGAVTLPGALVARWLLTRMSVKVHTIVTEVLVVVAGLSFLWRAV